MIVLLYILVCVSMAYVDAGLIHEGEKINHFFNGLVHFYFALLFSMLNWHYFFLTLVIARLSFDIALNYFRGLPFDYVPKNPKSIVDKIEKKLFFNNGIAPKVFYIGLIIFYYLFV